MQARRLGVGTEVRLLDGAGKIADGRIAEVSKRKVSVDIERVICHVEPELKLVLAVAMPKGDRQKQMVDSLTQLGVSRLIPMMTDYSVSVLKDNQLDKLRRIVLEACKQSQNPWALEIGRPAAFSELIGLGCDKYYAQQGGFSLQGSAAKPEHAFVFIGPEGGFSSAELDRLNNDAAQPIALGQHILRTESAAIAAAVLFKC